MVSVVFGSLDERPCLFGVEDGALPVGEFGRLGESRNVPCHEPLTLSVSEEASESRPMVSSALRISSRFSEERPDITD